MPQQHGGQRVVVRRGPARARPRRGARARVLPRRLSRIRRLGRVHGLVGQPVGVRVLGPGYPLVGDKLYSGNDETFLRFVDEGWSDWLAQKVLLPRMALHASRLEFDHPVTKTRLVFEDPVPEELVRFWNDLV